MTAVASNAVRTTAAALEEKTKLQKHFGRFDMFFFLVCTLVGLDTIGTVASNGAQLLAAGIDTDLQIVASTYAGGPAHEIAEVARDVDAGLIIAGTRGIGVIKGLLVGSVAHRLLYIATCPVLTVPLPPDSENG